LQGILNHDALVANESAWALGSYPTMSLSDARRKADERRQSVRDGVTRREADG
jgi:hypothetical protein